MERICNKLSTVSVSLGGFPGLLERAFNGKFFPQGFSLHVFLKKKCYLREGDQPTLHLRKALPIVTCHMRVGKALHCTVGF